MAIQRFRLALNNASFPFVSTEAPRAAFVPGLDLPNRAPRGYVAGPESADYNLTQIIYGENFMPVGSGVRSVGYKQIIAPTVNTDFDSVFPLRDQNENYVLYSPGKGKNYVYDTTASAWTTETIPSIYGLTLDSGSNPANSKVTYAYVEGYTFVCFSRLKSNDPSPVDMSILLWDPTTKTFDVPTAVILNLFSLSGANFVPGEIDGISASSGYLLVWSGNRIAWAFDFAAAGVFDFDVVVSGEPTGSSAVVPPDVKGPITAVLQVSGGFIAFTSRNAQGAQFNPNSLSTPWVFREIPDAGGLESYEQATVEGNLGAVIAYTTSGLQKVSLNSSELVHADLSDFIAARQIERYNNSTQTLTQASTTLDFYVKISDVGNRYIVLSYGTYPGIYSFALVYDAAVQRWGKLRIVHRDCFYYNYGVITAPLTYSMLGDIPYSMLSSTTYLATTQQSNAFTAAPHGLAFLLETGEVQIADWSKQERSTQDAGVVVIGRVQLTRARNIQLNRAEIEGFSSGDAYIVPSADGKTLLSPQALTLISAIDEYKLYGTMTDCKNFNLILQGTFDLSTIVLEAMPTSQL